METSPMEMDGEQVLRALREISGGIPVLFMSGHGSREVGARIAGTARVGHIAKPFGRAELVMSLRSLLEPPPR